MATGPERHGRRFRMVQGSRVETCGVLIAEADDHWRARILTYPNMLWTVPGGRGAIKFAGASAEEVEGFATAFIRDHARSRGLTLQEATGVVEPGRIEAERDPRQSPSRAQEERHPRMRPIRFGEDRATQQGETADFSASGLSIITDKPLPKGRRIKMVLDLGRYTIPLAGTVAWVRTRPEPGRSVGMGIQLIQAPPLYMRYVEAIHERETGTQDKS